MLELGSERGLTEDWGICAQNRNLSCGHQACFASYDGRRCRFKEGYCLNGWTARSGVDERTGLQDTSSAKAEDERRSRMYSRLDGAKLMGGSSQFYECAGKGETWTRSQL